jgi:hypothetical protein
MKNILFIILLICSHSINSKFINVLGIINRGATVPELNINDIEKDTIPFLMGNLMPQGTSIYNELGTLLIKRYIDEGLIKELNFDDKVKPYTSDQPSDVHSIIGLVMGIVPRNIPKFYLIDHKGHRIDCLGDFSFDKKSHYLKQRNFEKVYVEVMSSKLNVVLIPILVLT